MTDCASEVGLQLKTVGVNGAVSRYSIRFSAKLAMSLLTRIRLFLYGTFKPVYQFQHGRVANSPSYSSHAPVPSLHAIAEVGDRLVGTLEVTCRAPISPMQHRINLHVCYHKR